VHGHPDVERIARRLGEVGYTPTEAAAPDWRELAEITLAS
jgi:hypothetical protein